MGKISKFINSGQFATTTEIYKELLHLPGAIGQCLADNKEEILMEVGEGEWPWPDYIAHNVRMQTDHAAVISEYNANRKSTVGLNDVTIIALGKSLQLPVVSMESVKGGTPTRQRIPHVCQLEGVMHLTFNDFLRLEGITV